MITHSNEQFRKTNYTLEPYHYMKIKIYNDNLQELYNNID